MQADTINLQTGGFVRLDASMADDLSVVNSARVSFGKRVETVSAADEGLINFLVRERHGTPFEHNSFRFHVKVPIFVAREWFRHRIGWSYNEFSARYTEMPSDWYNPAVDKVRSQVGKPGNYVFETMPLEDAIEAKETISESIAHSYRTYSFLISKGVAKELARTVLPVGMFTEFYATCNARSLMNFISLRAADTAQYEIQEPANALDVFLRSKMPITHKAFLENGRVAP